MKRRFLTSLLAASMAAMTITGCGGSETSDSSGGGGSSKTITVGIWDNNQLAGIKAIADPWGEENGYEVEYEVLDWGTYWTLLEAGVSGGEMPDVFWMHTTNAQKYMQSGVLMELNDYIEKDDAIDMDNYYEGARDLYTLDGTYYAIPKDHDTIAVVYNKAIFDKYGVEYPTDDWTWEDYAKIAQEISEKGADDKIYGTYCNPGDDQNMRYDIIYAFGGEVINEDKTASGYDNPKTIEAMKFIADEILPACPSQDSMASTGGDTMFLSGLIGMEPQGSWNITTFYTADNADDFGWVMLPYADVNGNGQCDEGERVSIYNGLGWAAYADTKNPDAAWSLISALTCYEGQMKQSELGVTMSGYKGCSEAFADAWEGMDISAFTDIEEQGTLVFYPNSKNTLVWKDEVQDILVKGWENPDQMEEVCKEAAEQMNKDLADE